MKIILASASKRRYELLNMLNIPFSVMVSDSEEKLNSNKTPYEQCMDIAKEKALNVLNKTSGDVIVIASDTIVVCNNKIYGKPKNYDEAFQMLRDFANHEHEVISSLCLLVRKNGMIYEELTYDKCDVFVSNMQDDEIKSWIDNHNVYDKAGGYAIQEGFGKYIERIEGDYFSIVGLPLHKLYELLKKYYEIK